MKPETKAQIRAAISGGEANAPLLENGARWLLELLDEDDRREAVDHMVDAIPGDTLENMRMFVNGGIPGYCDHPGHDSVEEWIGLLLAERDRVAGVLAELASAELAILAGRGGYDALSTMAREVVKLRAEAREVARATAGESFAALVMRGLPEHPGERAAIREAMKAAAGATGLIVDELRAVVAPVDDALIDQVRAALASRKPGRWIGDRSCVYVAFDDPQIDPGFLDYDRAERAKRVEEWRATWDRSSPEQQAESTAAGFTRDAPPASFYGAYLGDLVAESIAPRDLALIAGAPEWLERLIVERAVLLEQRREQRFATVDPATLPAVGAPPMSETLGVSAPTDVARFDLGPQWVPAITPPAPSSPRPVAIDLALAPKIPERWAAAEAAAPIVVIDGFTLKDDAGGVVPRVALEADYLTPGAIVWRDGKCGDRCPDGLLGLILPPHAPEVEAAIDKRGIRADVERWRADPREVERAERTLAALRVELDRAEAAALPEVAGVCPSCKQPAAVDELGNARWHGGDGVTACDYRGKL